LSGRVFGCDICQDVCPWNRKANKHQEPAFKPEKGLLEMSVEDWHKLGQEEFERLFYQSAVQRAGYDKIRRNLASLQKKQDFGGQ